MRAGNLIDRRDFLRRSGSFAAVAFSARVWRTPAPEPGRLAARVRKPTRDIAPGDHILADDEGRRAILYVPPGYDAAKPAPFMLALHGATGSGDSMLRGSRAAANACGVIVLSPSSRDYTWDAIRHPYGEDLSRIDRMLSDAFDQCAVDPQRVAICGFSDGATYALSVGLVNGDLFTHVIGHSAGFIIPGSPHGKPKIFLSHGRQIGRAHV